ncbi:MAG TPA: class I SAM-dependent methyltransferase [Kofleriaceae bacterium]|nr:class I SAM-dependent methyltransferase [Kofleriaceae bacterium]
MTARRVREFFDRHALAYDARFSGGALATAWARLSRPAVFERLRTAASLVRCLGRPEVLDLGCGSGLGMIAMADAGARSITGVDFSARMLDLARRRLAARPRDAAIHLIEHDVLTWPGSPGGWDLTVALGVLEYYPDASGLVARMAELTRGWALFSVRAWSRLRGAIRARHYARARCPIYFVDRPAIDALCARAGFESWVVTPARWGSRLVLARR